MTWGAWGCALLIAGLIVFLPNPSAGGAAQPRVPSAWPDPSLNWQQLETEWFNVVFTPDLREIAEIAAGLARRAHRYWTEKLNYTPWGKTTLILMDRSDVSRVSTNLLPHNRIVLDHPVIGPSEGWTTLGRSDLEALIFRAYGEIVDGTRVGGLTADVRALLGKVVAPGRLKPLFLREGLALLVPGEAPPALAEMVTREMVLSRSFPTLVELSTLHETARWPPARLSAGAIGVSFRDYVTETYDPELPAALSRAYGERPLASVLGGTVFTRETDRTLGGLYREYQTWVKDRVERVRRDLEAAGGQTPSDPLSRWNYRSLTPRWSPEGTGIVYRHEDPLRGPQLRLVRPDGSQDRPLLSCPRGCGAPTWLGSNRLVYPKLRLSGDGRWLYDLYAYDLETGRERRLTTDERAYLVRAFPDGRRLLVARNHQGLKSSLIAFDPQTRARLILGEFDVDARVTGMDVSPDGTHIVLSLWRRGHGSDIVLMDRWGRGVVPLTGHPASDGDPVFSPDGRYVLFSSDRSGVPEIYAIRLEDRALFRITRTLTGALSPAPSPHGGRLAFVGLGPEGFGIRATEYDSASWTPVPVEASPDGPRGKALAPTPSRSRATVSGATPYRPGISLVPTFWVPLITPDHLGLFTWNSDPLGRHRYHLSLALRLDPLEFLYGFSYTNAQFFPRLRFDLRGGPAGPQQIVQVEFAFALSARAERAFSLGLDHKAGRDEIFARGRIRDTSGFDLLRRTSALLVEGGWIMLPGEQAHRLALAWREEVQLPVASASGPHRVSFNVKTAWSDGEAFRLGGTAGPYPLRGYEAGTASGLRVMWASGEYGFPVWNIDWSCCAEVTWPLLLDELKGLLFMDVGTAGDPLDLTRLAAGFGVELRLDLVLGYGLTSGTVRFGLAYGVGARQMQAYFELSPLSDDV